MDDNRIKVLIIEDDLWFAESLISGLNNFAIEIIKDPEDTFSAIEKNKPDVIVADVVLGSKNLFTLLNEMQSHIDTRDIPIIILSSQAKRISLADVKELKVKAIIDKAEVTPEILSREIIELIGQPERGES